MLDLTADNTVEWEQTDDIFRDLDQELRVRYSSSSRFALNARSNISVPTLIHVFIDYIILSIENSRANKLYDRKRSI